MIGIKPEWVEKILNGEKAIEIRKTKPKCELPIKVYIYCTKRANGFVKVYDDIPSNETRSGFKVAWTKPRYLGKVVAEFTLNEVKEHKFNYIFENPETNQEELTYNFTTLEMKNTGFDYSWQFDEFLDYYGKEKSLYAWHISDLKIYDKLKELNNFGLKKAPQSWQYIRE